MILDLIKILNIDNIIQESSVGICHNEINISRRYIITDDKIMFAEWAIRYTIIRALSLYPFFDTFFMK